MTAVGRAVDVKPIWFDMQKFNLCRKIYRYPYCNTRRVKLIKENKAKQKLPMGVRTVCPCSATEVPRSVHDDRQNTTNAQHTTTLPTSHSTRTRTTR